MEGREGLKIGGVEYKTEKVKIAEKYFVEWKKNWRKKKMTN